MQRGSSLARAPRVQETASHGYNADETYKRIIVACDGTWVNSQSGSTKASANIPSNVTRLSRAIKRQSSDGIPQVVYYHYGVGTQGGIVDRIYGGVTGEGLSENVREGYSFIATNYEPGDEIFLFGFSRGAFTARAIAGLIDQIGLLTRTGIPFLGEIFRDIQHRHDPDYHPKYPNIPFRNKPSADDPRYRQEMRRRGLTILGVTIRAVGVWETVGSLGTPRIGWLEKVGLQSSATKRMSFYDTHLSNCIENAFQALGLDEKRASFSPSVWEKTPENKTRLRQVWFPGVHANIGGGYSDQELANITLAWMVSQLRDFLDIDLDYILDEQEKTEDYYEKVNERPRPWSFGKIYNSMSGLFALGGERHRTPGRYFVIDPTTGRETDEPLRDTHEYVHPSVRVRIKLEGPGYDDHGIYKPRALKDWRLVVDPGESDGGRSARPDIYWQLTTRQKNVSTRILPESPLWPLERELLEMDPDREIEDYVMHPPISSKSARKTRSRRTRSDGFS